jgi:hypothetical protein
MTVGGSMDYTTIEAIEAGEYHSDLSSTWPACWASQSIGSNTLIGLIAERIQATPFLF